MIRAVCQSPFMTSKSPASNWRPSRFKRIFACIVATIATIAGAVAANPAEAWSSPDRLALPSFAAASKSSDWLPTPAGLVYRGCTHALPEGAYVNAAGNIVAGRSVIRVRTCPYGGLVIPDSSDTTTPYTGGWWLDSWWTSPSWLSRIQAEWTVPRNPTSNGATVFYFPSLENYAGTAILQPVVQWGPSAAGGGNSWGMAVWYINTSGTAYHSTLYPVLPGNIVDGSLESGGCSSDGSGCIWTMTISDGNIGSSSQRTVITPDIWRSAQGGVMEVYNASACSQLPHRLLGEVLQHRCVRKGK